MPWSSLRVHVIAGIASGFVFAIVAVPLYFGLGHPLSIVTATSGVFIGVHWVFRTITDRWTLGATQWLQAVGTTFVLLVGFWVGIKALVDIGQPPFDAWWNAFLLYFFIPLTMSLVGGGIAKRFDDLAEAERAAGIPDFSQFEAEVPPEEVVAFEHNHEHMDFVHTPGTGKVIRFQSVPRENTERET